MGIIVSVVLLIFAPNLADDTCREILALLPEGVSCQCSVDTPGFFSGFDLKAEASCEIPFDIGLLTIRTCEVTAVGEGNALAMGLTGDSGTISFGTDCNFGNGEVSFSTEGDFFTSDSVEIGESCSVSATIFPDNLFGAPATFPDQVLLCTCENLGCPPPSPISNLLLGFLGVGDENGLGDTLLGVAETLFSAPLTDDALNAEISCIAPTLGQEEVFSGCVNLALVPLVANTFATLASNGLLP